MAENNKDITYFAETDYRNKKTPKTYTIAVTRNNTAQATPTFSPVAGAIAFGNVTITSAGADSIHYTTNGTDPTTSDPSVASGGTVTISSAVTLKALAVKAGSDNSAIGSAVYTQAVSANLSALALSDVILSPVFAGGTYSYTSPAVANAISTTRVTATGAGVLQMSVGGVASTTITTGVQSGELVLTAGATTTIYISLTETGKATTTYAVGVYRNNEVVYALRTTGPGGGLVFYDKGSYSNGWRYMEAAPSDQSAGVQWGSYGILAGADGLGIGTGKQNTADIINGVATRPIAASVASTTINGYSDWFLPSKYELHQMYLALKVYGVGNFSNVYYWSSTESTNRYSSHVQRFSDGYQNVHPKNNETVRVRSIRSF